MAFNPLAALGEATVIAPQAPGTPTGTLVAATPLTLTFDTSTASRICIAIQNTGGTNPIGTTMIEKSPNGVVYFQDTDLNSAIGSIAAGASVGIELSDCSFSFLRITLTSGSGTTYAVGFKGVR